VTTLYPLFRYEFYIGMTALAINVAVVGLGTGNSLRARLEAEVSLT
jgi:SSS family solute:Na+ symporter